MLYGFLGKEAKKISQQIFEEYEDFFELFYKINNFSENTKSEFIISQNNGQQLVSYCLFLKILEGVQAVSILIERGFDLEIATLIRGNFESYVLLKLCCCDEEFSQKYILKSFDDRLKFVEKAMKYKEEDESYSKFLERLEKDEGVENYISKLKDIMSQTTVTINREDFKIYNLAEKAGEIPLYRSLYHLTSNAAHSSPIAIENYILEDSDGELLGFNHGPSTKRIKTYLVTITESLFVSLKVVCDFFKIDKDTEIEEMHAELLNLHESTK